MASELEVAVRSIQQNNYVSLAVITAVGYDYVLTLSNEIEYVWNKPWTRVSTLFLFVRYIGLYSLILPSLVGSSFLPGPAKTYVAVLCEIINIVYGWTLLMFVGSADFVMVLRVWAMYNRSRVIIAILLLFFFLEIVFTLIGVIIYSNPRNRFAITAQILNFTVCAAQPNSITWTKVSVIFQGIHNAVLCLLAVAQFVRQSVQMYGTTGSWHPNRYMALFIREGILYFFAILLFDIIDVLGISGEIPSGGWGFILASILANVPMYTLAPRFILSMRALYARDAHPGRGSGMDSGFGLAERSHGAGGMMVFAAATNEGGEEIPMEDGAR